MKRILLVWAFFVSTWLGAQSDSAQREPRMVPIQTFPVNAQVIGTLEGTDDMAVLRIEKVDSNAMGLSVDDEILVEFYFSLKPIKNTGMTGLKEGDHFSVRMSAKRDQRAGQWQYTAYHYKKRPTKSPATPAGDESQK